MVTFSRHFGQLEVSVLINSDIAAGNKHKIAG